MADSKLTALTALTSATDDDILYIVDDPAGVPVERKITKANLLAGLAPLASPAFTGTPTGITKAHVGLGSADNTTDVGKPVSTAQQTALDLKSNLAGPTFTGVPAAPTAAAGTNTTQLATTAFVTAINNNAAYTTVKSGAGSHIAAKVAGNYVFPPAGGVMAVGGTGTLYPQQVFYLTGADFPTINGIATKLRIKGSVFCNNVAPTGNFTFGLYPITRPASSGGAGLCIYTVGIVVAGSNGAVVTTPAADSSTNAIGADFAIPADDWYALVCVTTATIATSAHTHLTCELQMRNA